jgi:iron complex outermembrane receptor protein
VVNVVTRHGSALSGAEAVGAVQSHGTYAAGATLGSRLGRDAELLISGVAYRRHGADLRYPEFAGPATNNGVAADRDRAERGLVKLRLGDVTVEGALSSRRKTVPTASYGTTFNDPRFVTRDRQAFASVQLEHPFADLSRIWASLTYNWYRYDGRYPYDSTLSRDYASADWWTLEGQYLRLIGAHKLSVGGELRWNSRQDQGVFDDQPRVYSLRDSASSWVGAGFVQGEFQLSPQTVLYAGVRHDQYARFGGTTNPRAALVFAVGPRSHLKALYGRAFRAPNAYERSYGDGGVTQKPAPDLRPETIQTFELVGEQQIGNGLRATVSAYHLAVKDLIGLTTDPADSLLVFQNLSRARSTGIEAELRGRVGGVEGRVSYAYQRASEGARSAAPVNSPRHLARLGLSVPLAREQFRSSVEVRHVSRRPTVAGASASAYTVANLTVRFLPRFLRETEASLTVYNLTNAAYGDPGGEEHVQDVIRQDGREFRVGVRVGF